MLYRKPLPALLFVSSMAIVAAGMMSDEVSDVSITREIEDGADDVRVGEMATVRMNISSGRGLKVIRLKQPDPFAADTFRRSFLFSRGGEVNASFLAANPGKYELEPLEAEISDIFGVSSRTVVVGKGSVIEVRVDIRKGRGAVLPPSRARNIAGNVVSRSKGGSSEFYSVIEYQDGSNLSRINWKVSARREGLWANQYLQERSGRTFILADARRVDADGHINAYLFRRTQEALLSLAYAAIMERNAVGVIVVTDSIRHLNADFGRRHFARIDEFVSRLNPASEFFPGSLDRTMRLVGDRRAQLIIISSLTGRDVEEISECVKYCRDASVIVPAIEARFHSKDPEGIMRSIVALRQENNGLVLSNVCPSIFWKEGAELQYAVGMYKYARRSAR